MTFSQHLYYHYRLHTTLIRITLWIQVGTYASYRMRQMEYFTIGSSTRYIIKYGRVLYLSLLRVTQHCRLVDICQLSEDRGIFVDIQIHFLKVNHQLSSIRKLKSVNERRIKNFPVPSTEAGITHFDPKDFNVEFCDFQRKLRNSKNWRIQTICKIQNLSEIP